MRVTFGASQRVAEEGITRAASRMAEFQRQVSTGIRVQRPSDDPSAAARAIVERGAMASFEQFTQASDSAESRLRVVDSVLSDIIDKLSAARAVVLSVQGSTATASQREASAQELQSLREAVLEDLKTTFRGVYLFSGAAGTVAPFEKDAGGTVLPYAGSTREVEVDIDRGRAIAVSFDGSAIAQGADATDVFAAFDAASAAAVVADGAALSDAFDALSRAFDRTTQAQSRVGTNLRAVADTRLMLGESARASEARVSALEDANLARAISGMQQAETTYAAALGAAARTSRISLFDFLE
jgi:flagellar hook-associated protein 3 FlgL